MEAFITWSTLIDIAPESIADIQDCDAGGEKYRAWTPFPETEEARMDNLGQLVTDDLEAPDTMQVYEGSNYWSPDDPIALGYYPYNYCEVFQKKDCNSYYLVYTEWGGHIPERRARLVLKPLIMASPPGPLSNR